MKYVYKLAILKGILFMHDIIYLFSHYYLVLIYFFIINFNCIYLLFLLWVRVCVQRTTYKS